MMCMTGVKKWMCVFIGYSVILGVMASSVLGKDSMDITIGETIEHRVRFTSDKTVYTEMLLGDRWVGSYWSADSRADYTDRQFTEPAFEIQVKDNPEAMPTNLTGGWQWVSGSELPKTDRGARHFVVKLSHKSFSIEVKVHTLLDGTPVLTRWLEITNTSSKSVALTAISPWSGRLWSGGNDFIVGYQTRSEPGVEGWFEWNPLPSGTTRAEGARGHEGHDDPFFIARNAAGDEYFICHLAWSANYRIEFTKDEGLSFSIGPCAKDALRVIAPGETVHAPVVHLGYVKGDLDVTVQSMHDHIRRYVLPRPNPKRAYQIQFGVPGDQGFYMGGAFTEANVRKLMDVAAAVGVELFILDAGWYDVYGEWVPSPSKFPNGLSPLVEYAHGKGLTFGLYAEPEGGRGNWGKSKVYNDHPDWFGPQSVMNLQVPEAATYMESEIARLIDTYKPDLYRHDFIPGPPTLEWSSTLRDGFMENNYWRYYDNYNGIWDRIRVRYPGVILQMCTNGGAREDLATMSRVHETYTNEGAPTELGRLFPTYSGKTLALPPEVLVIGLRHYYTDSGHLDTSLRMTFTLSTPWILGGPTPSVDILSMEKRDRYLYYANIYKIFIRPILPKCKVYHHAPISATGGITSSTWFAMEFTSPDKSKGWATIVHLGDSESDTYLFKPRGLDENKKYTVMFDNTGRTEVIDGASLMQDGFSICLPAVPRSELLLFEETKQGGLIDKIVNAAWRHLAIPVFNPPDGDYTKTQSVNITSPLTGTVIRYTTDGSEPTESSPTYTGALTVAKSTLLKAKAYKPGIDASYTADAQYHIRAEVPVFNHQAGTYTSEQRVIIITPQSDVAIYYTTDGTEPTNVTGMLYKGPVTVDNRLVLKARAYKSGVEPSVVKSWSRSERNDPALAGEWHIDEGHGNTITDSSQYGNTGTIYGATWTDGRFGKALSFDGNDDYVRVPDNSSFPSGNDDFTIEAWIKPIILDGDHRIIITNQDIDHFQFVIYGNTGELQMYTGDGSGVATPGLNWALNTWHHVAVTRDNSGIIRIYKDGVECGMGTDTDSITRSDIDIGLRASTRQHPFKGVIDEIVIYKRALASTEIKNYYEMGKTQRTEF